MKSRAQFRSHPIHPILVAFPIAFFAGALLFDILGYWLDRPAIDQTAHYLVIAGIAMGVVAAVPGFIDLMSTVPPKSSARRRGIRHGLLNTTVLILFGIVLWLRSENTVGAPLRLGIECLAVILLTVSGFLGGTLVYRNQIGVDIRYANAGKRKEQYLGSSNGKIKVHLAEELRENQMMLIHSDGKRIVLARTETGYVAFSDHCTHRGGSLAGGAMICGTVQCPWHGSQFDVTTGELKAGPAQEGITVFPVMVEDNSVFIVSGTGPA